MDVALQRPLLITCSKADATIKVWNYNTFTCEVTKRLTFDKDKIDISETLKR